MLSSSDRKLYERYIKSRDEFSLVSNNDLGARRYTKIAIFKQENELKLKLEVCTCSATNNVLPDNHAISLESATSATGR